jgi:ABC-2 type transport system permease protein
MSARAETFTVPVSPTVPSGGIRWVLADAWTIAQRFLRHWRQQPGPVLIGWFFPVLILLMFGGLFGGAISVPGGGSYFDFLMPGMFTLAMFFGLEATVLGVTTDAQKGVTDRFRTLPISGVAIVLGRCLADLLSSVIGLVILIGTGLALGWRWHNGLGAALAAVGLLLLFRFAMLWVGIVIGLSISGPEWVSAVQILIWPIGFLSSVFVDPASMPGWLGAIAAWNPISITASAVRELFGNPGYGGTTWLAENAIPMAVLTPLAITVIFLPLAAWAYRRG